MRRMAAFDPSADKLKQHLRIAVAALPTNSEYGAIHAGGACSMFLHDLLRRRSLSPGQDVLPLQLLSAVSGSSNNANACAQLASHADRLLGYANGWTNGDALTGVRSSLRYLHGRLSAGHHTAPTSTQWLPFDCYARLCENDGIDAAVWIEDGDTQTFPSGWTRLQDSSYFRHQQRPLQMLYTDCELRSILQHASHHVACTGSHFCAMTLEPSQLTELSSLLARLQSEALHRIRSAHARPTHCSRICG